MAVKTTTRDNLLYKITLRETKGSFQRSSLFRRCPGRFCVPLRSLVTEEQLQRGHVFLGFTKCGQYMLSYQQTVLPQYSFPLLLFQYTLHWWQFCLRKPLKLIRSVPLFAGEEIDSDLHLIISQSMDESKVVVCGICRGNKEEPSHMCYITICAAPPRRPCSKCQECFPHAIYGKIPPCLKHSFAVHFKFSLLPPFPLFNPSICLQMDGVVLFSTTDSLLALNVVASSAEEERQFCRKLPFQLKETSECLDPSQSIYSSCALSQNLPSSAEEVVPAVHELEDDTNIPSMTADDANSSSVTTDHANSSSVTVHHGNTSSVTACDANASSVIADNRNISNVTADVSSMTGDDANVLSMTADDGNASSVTAYDENVSSVTADDGNASSMTADDGNISSMTVDDANVLSVTADDANASSMTAGDRNASSVTADDGNVSSVTADDRNASNVTANDGNVSSVTADDGNVPSMTDDDGNVSSVTTDGNASSATADDGNISSVTADDGNVRSVTDDDGNVSIMTTDGNVSSRTLQTTHKSHLELVQLQSCVATYSEQSVGDEVIPEGPWYQVLEKTDQEQSTANSAVDIGDNGFERPQDYSSAKSETGCGEGGDCPNSSGECINEEQRIGRGAGADFRPNEEDSHAALAVCSQIGAEESDSHQRNRDSLPGSERLDSSLDGSTTSLEVEPDRVLTTCSCKVFTEELFSHGGVEDTSTFYELETVLPVTVTKLPVSTPLSCVCMHDARSSYTAFENDLSRYTSPFVIIGQVSLDLEKCICELVESHEALRNRYKSLRDYDTEIIAVCPHTAEVIVLMKILVYVRGPRTTTSFGLPISPSPSLKSTGFVFSWNIHTGQVKSLHNMALHDFSEKKHNFKFNLAASEAAELWRKVTVPRSIGTRVQAFSNHTVFGGKSLKYLKHPNLPFAVVLQ